LCVICVIGPGSCLHLCVEAMREPFEEVQIPRSSPVRRPDAGDSMTPRESLSPRGGPGLTTQLGWEHEKRVDAKQPIAVESEDERSSALRRELDERKALTDAVFAASVDGICILDPDGVFLEVNAAYERMTGIPRDRWIGRRVEEMQKLPGVPKHSATLDALRGNRPASTLVNVRGGELVLITASPHYGAE